MRCKLDKDKNLTSNVELHSGHRMNMPHSGDEVFDVLVKFSDSDSDLEKMSCSLILETLETGVENGSMDFILSFLIVLGALFSVEVIFTWPSSFLTFSSYSTRVWTLFLIAKMTRRMNSCDEIDRLSLRYSSCVTSRMKVCSLFWMQSLM